MPLLLQRLPDMHIHRVLAGYTVKTFSELRQFMKYHFFSLLTLLALGLTTCKDGGDPTRPDLVIPATYNATTFSANNMVQSGVISRFSTLVSEAKKGRINGTVVNPATLTQLFDADNPSLKSQTTAYYAALLEGSGKWFDALSQASGNTYTPGTPVGQGGTFGGYLFDENGLEMEQLVDKGLFGAALYNHALQLTNSTMTVATADQMLTIVGGNPTFPNSDDATKHAQPDKYLLNYAARRDKNDGTGLYTQIKNNFIKLQAALAAGADYNPERDAAIADIQLLLEKVNAATTINYCHSVISTLSTTNPTDEQKAAALHAYGECVGFIHGWRTVAAKKISDSEIDEILILLNAPVNGTPQSYLFVTDALNQLPKLQQVIAKLKTLYGFSDQEIEDFKKNWVKEQNR